MDEVENNLGCGNIVFVSVVGILALVALVVGVIIVTIILAGMAA